MFNCQHYATPQSEPCRICRYVKPVVVLVKSEKYERTQEDRDTKRAIAEKERKYKHQRLIVSV